MVIQEKMKILLYFLIDVFCLAISLWVICSRDVDGDTKQLVEVMHEIGGELHPTDADDAIRQVKVLSYMVTVYPH